MKRIEEVIAALFFGGLALAVAGLAAPARGEDDPDWVKETAVKRLVYRAPNADRATVRTESGCRREDGSALPFDIYRGADAGEARLPVVILIHGGPLPEL